MVFFLFLVFFGFFIFFFYNVHYFVLLLSIELILLGVVFYLFTGFFFGNLLGVFFFLLLVVCMGGFSVSLLVSLFRVVGRDFWFSSWLL